MPELAADITPEELEKDVRDELRSLPNDLASLIACHLVAAERALGEEDAALAYEHAKVARRFAARIGVVREAVGLAAYRAGHYAEALSDLRAARRMTGSDEFLPIMADCERGLGRPERALDLVRSREAERLDRAGRIELAIVESGARRDLGQHDAAVITLQRVPELRNQEPHPWSARLAYAYADALAEAGHEGAATDWFERAMMFDEGGETEAAERYAELTGAVIEDIEDEDDENVALDLDADDENVAFDLDADADVASDLDADVASDLDEDDRDAEATDTEARQRGEKPAADASGLADEDSEDDFADDSVADDLELVGAKPAAHGPESAREEPGTAADEPGTAVASDKGNKAGERDAVGGDLLDSPEAEPVEVPDDSLERSVIDGPGVVPGKPETDPAVRDAAAGTSAAEAAKPELKTTRLEVGMAPAFIEPDFGVSAGAVPGDVLDDEDDADGEQPGSRKA
ncbi:MSCRAMM family adhesin SdrC [Sphaerisporangium sp. NBC_01403]|uniref:hypothetical protein n=1 Tax=Sphaerisporangium sp. NBC_01403 TaxID=2903599 RepID=UPI00324E1861